MHLKIQRAGVQPAGWVHCGRCTVTAGAILTESELVPAQSIPVDVVTMYSQLILRDLKTHYRDMLMVRDRTDAEPDNGYISVVPPRRRRS
jgi:hypothetical protein